MTQEQQGHWLERKIAALDALYHKFGRDGFRDQQLADVQLLLSVKELQFRDAAKGRDLSEVQKAANRQLAGIIHQRFQEEALASSRYVVGRF